MTMVLVAAGILSIVMLAGLSIADLMRSQTAGLDSKIQGTRFGNYLSTALEDPTICAGTGGPGTGLTFYPFAAPDVFSGSPAADQFSAAVGPNDKQYIYLPTNFSNDDGTCCRAVANNADVPAFKVHVQQFYISNVTGPTASGVYSADAYVAVKDTQTGTVLNRQKLGSIYVTLSGTSLATCQMQLSAQDVCEQMATPSSSGPQSCRWMDASVTPRCRCNTPAVDCSNAYGDGNGYVYGFASDGSVICKNAAFQCSPGQFLQGFDASGNQQCVSAASAGL